MEPANLSLSATEECFRVMVLFKTLQCKLLQLTPRRRAKRAQFSKCRSLFTPKMLTRTHAHYPNQIMRRCSGPAFVFKWRAAAGNATTVLRRRTAQGSIRFGLVSSWLAVF